MSESDRKHVDGCAIFYRTSKFTLVKEQLVEFNQLAIEHANGHEDMLNRVMTKDNIALAALLQTKEACWENGVPPDHKVQHSDNFKSIIDQISTTKINLVGLAFCMVFMFILLSVGRWAAHPGLLRPHPLGPRVL